MSKKILIVYATAGAGHKKAAEAIYHEARQMSDFVQMVDIVSFMSPLSRKIYSDGYALLISRFVGLWGVVYFLSDTPFLKVFNVHLRRFFDKVICRKFIDFLEEEKFDIIISTQFLASEMVGYAKAERGLKARLITVVTDLGVHNFWINPLTDIYCCAAESTKRILRKKGIGQESIRVTGIPVDGKFLTTPGRDSLCAEFKIKSDLFTVLVMTGGVGIGPIEQIVAQVRGAGQILVVCGNNRSLYGNLLKRNYPDVYVFGFVDFVEKLMKVSDLIVTKAGGLSVTESLTSGLPMIFFFLIPGQERINAETIASLGAGLIATSADKIKDEVLKFRNDPDLLARYKEAALALSKPLAARQIVSLVNQ